MSEREKAIQQFWDLFLEWYRELGLTFYVRFSSFGEKTIQVKTGGETIVNVKRSVEDVNDSEEWEETETMVYIRAQKDLEHWIYKKN